MTILTDTIHTAGFLVSEANGMYRSRDKGIVAGGSAPGLAAGTLLSLSSVPTATAGAVVSGSGGTPGNGAIGTVTADAGAEAGTYQIVILKAASDGGNFEVRKPDGSIDGNGAVGTAYNGSINFTLADGSTDFVVADRIPVEVVYGDAEKSYAVYTGDAPVAAILFEGAIGTVERTVITRDAEVVGAHLTYQSGADDDAKAAANADLAALGIIVR
jgi:hypothetical protein